MSLYNMLFGYNPSCVIILPMLGRKPEEYPRFRDCYVTEEHNIAIYTRVGGENRKSVYHEEFLYEDENFITTYDDDYDNTYGTYEFRVPEKWKADFDLIMSGKTTQVSTEYIELVKSFFPQLAENGQIDKIFSSDIETE